MRRVGPYLLANIISMARLTSFAVGDLVHCVKRGAFGNDIFRDQSDYWRFVRLLYICNDEYIDNNHFRFEKTLQLFDRPAHWPVRQPLTEILSWCAMPNHFHILLQEKQEGGIGKFMQRLGGSMTMSFNKKYENQGSIFQAKYKPVLVVGDDHLYHLIPYINVKNVMELYPDGGLERAWQDFDMAWEWAKDYRFSSMKTFSNGLASPILAMETIRDYNYPISEVAFKEQARECISLHLNKRK